MAFIPWHCTGTATKWTSALVDVELSVGDTLMLTVHLKICVKLV